MNSDYEILDSGAGRKLERVGNVIMDRQCAVAFWEKTLGPTEWAKAQAVHHRSEKGGGHWNFKSKVPESWSIDYGGLKLQIKSTSFGHLGFFAEQAQEWQFLKSIVREKKPLRILNLFAYTGGSSLACALAGAETTHLDAAKGVVDWARENADLNGVEKGKIRWIVDDALSFLKREARRGSFYDGIILDPPSFGRGPKKEIFKIEDDINTLLESVFGVLSTKPALIHFSCHTPGFSPQVLENLIKPRCQAWAKSCESGEMTVTENSGRKIPSGTFCRIF